MGLMGLGFVFVESLMGRKWDTAPRTLFFARCPVQYSWDQNEIDFLHQKLQVNLHIHDLGCTL